MQGVGCCLIQFSLLILFEFGDRRSKRTHFGELIGVENGPTAVISGSFEPFWLAASGTKDVDGGRLRTDQACSSGWDEHSRDGSALSSFAAEDSADSAGRV